MSEPTGHPLPQPLGDDVPPYTDGQPTPGVGLDGGWVDPDQDETSAHAEFDGDVGGLSPLSRRALVLVMKNRFITARSHRAEFEALVKDQALVRARLNDMYLSLEIDHERQVAYKQQVVADSHGRFPTLLHSTEWPREETILMVRLRSLVRAGRATGNTRTFVDRQDLLDHLAELAPETDTDRVDVTRRTTRAIEALVSAGLLLGRKDADTFEIDPAIEALLTQKVLEQLLTWIRAHKTDTSDGAPALIDPADAEETR